MVFKRRLGRKGQIIIPKAIREILGIGPGDEVVMEIREKEVVIKPEADPVRFVEDFCSIVGQKLTERIDLEKLFLGKRLRGGLLYLDSNIFIARGWDKKNRALNSNAC